MANSSDQAVDQQGAIDDVLADYLQRVDEGEAIDRDEFIAAHPDVADALKSYFAGADEVDRVAGPTVGETMGATARENDTAVASESQPAAAGTDGAIPREFGRYRVVRTLGTGAMGAVYLADDTQLDRQVALKVPKFAKKERSELLLRFNREAKAAATLSHPNVCPVFDVGEIDGTHFISMGYVEGRPLNELIDPARSLSEVQVASVIRKLALALAEAHQKGVVHRDIKPANIMIDKRREPIIMDFGLARSLAATDEERVTHDGAIVGTPAYMPPEQIKGEIAEVGPAADIYSLGVVMYEMLTGRLPFSGSITEVIARVLHDPTPSPAELRPDIDRRLNDICMKAMSKAIADRYASMNDLAADLTGYLQQRNDQPANNASSQQQTGKTNMASTPQQSPSKSVQKPAAGEFDPYHKWLGIPPKEQPPNHYRLLAIELFEADPDAIQSAAIARSTYVRQCATGPHAAVSQEVLNELSEAEICLLNVDKKAAYDAQLKAELEAKEAAKPQAATETVSTGKKAKPAADSKLAQQIQKLDKQKKQIESLLDKCEFATAIAALEKMAAVKSPKLAKYAKWAKQQIPKAKRGTKEMRESSAAVYRTAADLFDRNDYEEAAEMLQQIPKKYRDAEFSELLQECLDLQEEIVVLQENIDHAESLNKYQDLQPTVERLLELKPADRRARRLLKELKTYGKGGGMRLGGRGDKRFDAAGNTSNPLKVALGILIPMVLFGAVGYATVVYVRSNNKTIKIEIDDPSAKVVIDGETVKITGVGDEITLKVGTHDLVVERDGLVVHTKQFEVVKGKNPVLRISLEDAAIADAGGGENGNADEEVVYLADLKEVSVNDGPWPFSKGKVGDSQIRWQGVAYPNALSMHPPGSGSRIVKYQLSKRYREFESKVGLTLAKTPAESLLTFSVVGDGKELWKSKPTRQPDPPQSCRVDVSNVDLLELHVNSPGGAAGAHAAWFDPRLTGGTSGPSPAANIKFTQLSPDEAERLVDVAGTKPVPLVLGGNDGKGWYDIPGFLRGACIYSDRAKGQGRAGFADFTAKQDTDVYLACSWAYEGNRGGGWYEQIVTDAGLQDQGWEKVGHMYANVHTRYRLFKRRLKQGEKFEYRTNKYSYPYVLVGSSDPGPADVPVRLDVDAAVQVVAPSKTITALKDIKGVSGIPAELQDATAYTGGAATYFTVCSDQTVYVAASWQEAANRQGQWVEDQWKADKFEAEGWKDIGKITFSDGKDVHTLFSRDCKKGETFWIRTRKRAGPVLIVKPAAQQSSVTTNLSSSGFVEVRLTGRIDGLDEVRISKNGADWNHRESAWPTELQINGKVWSPQTQKLYPNSGSTKFLPDSARFEDATVNIRQGRGGFYFEKNVDRVYLAFKDDAGGAGIYDVTFRIPVGQSPAQRPSKPGMAAVRLSGTIDGNDELRLYKGRADWNHRDQGWPTQLKLNGKDWNPQGSLKIANTGGTRFMPDTVNFQGATLTISEGRGPIFFRKLADHVYVNVYDYKPGADVYDVTVEMPSGEPATTAAPADYAPGLIARMYSAQPYKDPKVGETHLVSIIERSDDVLPGRGAAPDAGWLRDRAIAEYTKDVSELKSVQYVATGYIVLDADTDVKCMFQNCRCEVDGKIVNNTGSTTVKKFDLPLTKGAHAIKLWRSDHGQNGPRFTIEDPQSGKSVLFHTQSDLQKELARVIDIRGRKLPSSLITRTGSAPAGTPSDVSKLPIVCQLLQSKRAPQGLIPAAVKFAAPRGDGRSGANGFLLDAPAGWDTKGTIWSCDFARDGASRGVVFIHPYQDGHVMVVAANGGLHVGSPGEWPNDRSASLYGPRYKGFPLKTSPDFKQVFRLGDQSHQLVSKLAADGSYEFLLDGKVVATTQVTAVLPLKFTDAITVTKPPAKGTGGAIVGPTDGGSARASNLRFGVIGGSATAGVDTSNATNRQIAERILGLGGSIVTDSGVIKTVDELPQQPFEIRQIVLSNTQITNDGLADLQRLQSLTVLRLENTSIGDAGLAHLKGLTNLETLLLTGTQVTDAGLVHLRGMTKLDNLLLGDTLVTADGLQHLAALESLATLRLTNTKVDDASLVHLKGLTNLTSLSLDDTSVGDAGLTHLKEFANLETLILSGTQVTDAGLANLEGMTKLRHLYLNNTPVTGDGLKHVAGLNSLASLRLTNTQVDNSDLVHVKGLTNLTNIYLDKTPVSDAGLEQLKGLTNLDIIVLTGTQVTDAGLVHLQGMTRLAHLYLGNTAVTGNGLKQVEELTTLLSLRLTNTQVDDSGLAHLNKMKKLADLRVDGTKVTANGVANLQKTLPNCRVTR